MWDKVKIFNFLFAPNSCEECRFWFQAHRLKDNKEVVAIEQGHCVLWKEEYHKDSWCSAGIK